MNRKQKKATIIVTTVIYAMLIYVTMMYAFFVNDPKSSINIPQLLTQWVGFAIALGLLFIVLKDME